jgi:serine/threonine-protein kinase HipA
MAWASRSWCSPRNTRGHGRQPPLSPQNPQTRRRLKAAKITHTLHVWAEDAKVATIEHEGRDDRWGLSYAEPWVADAQSFPLSPALPLMRPPTDYASPSIKRFIEHLLLREIPLQELDQRIAEREHAPLTVWEGKVRMSVAGLQDKLPVYLDRTLLEGGRLFLVDGQRLATTHILKPDTANPQMPHLAVNEHFCMSLARRMQLPVAEVGLLRTPRPVLVVRRFDREVETAGGQPRVHRRHIIDAAQACDLPVTYKYERNLGSAEAVRHIRDGMSFECLLGCADLTANKAAARLAMLRWALFQFLIGNSDAHGKNFSFFVRPGGLLEPTPWYDLLSVLQYDGFDTDLAMAYGDAFSHAEVSASAFADFAARCGIDRKLMRREGQRLAKLAAAEAAAQAQAADYVGEAERTFVQGIADFVAKQAERLTQLVADAARWKHEYL